MAPSKLRQDNEPDDSRFRGKLKKLLLYRLVLAVFFLVLALAVQSARNADLLSSNLHPLYIFSCILLIFTILGALSLERVRHLVRFACVQILFDLGAVSVLVYMTGGIESSFSFLYMLVIISSALLLYRRGSLLTASACSLIYGLLLDLQYFGWISPLQLVAGTGQARDSGTYFFTILMHVAGFFLLGFVAGYLAEEVQKYRLRVSEGEGELRKLATLHASIVQSMSSGLLTLDLNGLITFSNNAAQEILGMKSGDIAGHCLTELFSGVELAGLTKNNQAEGRGPANRREADYAHPSGVPVTIGYSASVLQNENAETFGWTIIFIDLTRFKAIEEHIQRMERLVLAGRFAAEIAHEIKNPLAAISGAMQMLRGEVGQNELNKKLMGIVQREIERINALVTEFLWMAKGSPKSAQTEDVPVCPVIEEIIALLKAKKQLNASHKISTYFKASPSVKIDPNHLHRVLWNLLVNALEAMPQGGELSISVNLQQPPDNPDRPIRIEIGDSGCGIAESAFKRIFDPFFTTKANGTGLGLSIVYQLVEKAGGYIEVSRPHSGSGTIFSLLFPQSCP
ncbi:PAS/PAC sensor signal transduction histidine kinase [Syntrophobacter sp. SbD1]|nr:PAS/PAC sensor signal transduction histidine kinase [Syntrophobacter sp. SbD1]